MARSPNLWRPTLLTAVLAVTAHCSAGASSAADSAASAYAGDTPQSTGTQSSVPSPSASDTMSGTTSSGTSSSGTSDANAATSSITTPSPSPAPSPTITPGASVLRPSTTNQAGLDAALLSYYNQWKSTYLTQGQCPSGQLYVNSSSDAGGANSISVSEAQGYGMLALVLMSSVDTEAHADFDQMVAFLLAHPSAAGSGLMAWNIDAPCTSVSGAGSAADADLDIAYALLLADSTWGSSGSVNYLAQAKRVITALMTTEVNQQGHYVTLWENVATSDSHYGGTRVSDMMMDHFRAFAKATSDSRWTSVVNSGYGILTTLQSDSSDSILPDFAINAQNTAQPAGANFLEGVHDGQYYYNACRLPWRLAMDYILYNDTHSQTITANLVNALRVRANGNPASIVDGYDLQGNAFGTNNNLAFMAPLAVGSMVSGNQAWVDSLWQTVVNRSFSSDQYYGHTIKLMSMIVIAGHYRAP